MRRPAADLNEVERVVFDFFSESAKVTKLVEFLSLEEHKGRDKFDSRRFFMFKVGVMGIPRLPGGIQITQPCW